MATVPKGQDPAAYEGAALGIEKVNNKDNTIEVRENRCSFIDQTLPQRYFILSTTSDLKAMQKLS
jgi:hypothetical protein